MTKKLVLILFILHVTFFTCIAQQYWVQRAGGITIDEGVDIATDANGNSYSTGYFTTYATFGTTTLHAAGNTDIYIVKLNHSGEYDWAIKAGGTGIDRPTAIKVDAIGNSYVTGYFYGTAHFGAYTVTAAGLQDIFIAKYDSGGICQWAKSCGGTGGDIGNGIAVDFSGNVIVTGQFSGSAMFGSINLISMNGSVDVFTTKLDANGNFLWAKKGSGPADDRGLAIACDAWGNAYVTGQFSDTITFDVQHDNQMYNALFILKYDASGNELWFRKAGGGGLEIPRAIAVDNIGNMIVAGDFQGDLTFYSCPNNTTLTNTYSNRIFLAKFNGAGNMIWNTTSGSDAGFTVKNMAVDRSNNLCVLGNFQCRLAEYADHYGQGTFNSIGYWDIYVSKWNPSGTWLWSRQTGGQYNDNGTGIAIDTTGQILITGGFYKKINFPVQHSKLIGYNYSLVDGCVSGYCNDTNYDNYEHWLSHGSSDIFIARAIDTARQPYDYYIRTDSACNRDMKKVYIIPSNQDTVHFCNSGTLYTNSNTCGAIGPTFTYLWSTGATNANLYSVTVSGSYWVRQTTEDGCFVSSDSMYVMIHPTPPKPTITDDHVINTNAINPSPIVLCPAGPVLLTGRDSIMNQYQWNGGPLNDSTLVVNYSGQYTFTVTDSFGCNNSNYVQVIMDSALVPIIPGMLCIQDTLGSDTISICQGLPFAMFVFDTLTNPNASVLCSPYLAYDPYALSSNPDNPLIYWTVTPNTFTYNDITSNCFSNPPDGNNFVPNQSSLYTITAMILRATACDSDTVVISRSIYVRVVPIPTAAISGNPFYCLGDSTLLTASSGDIYTWSTPITNSIHLDSLWVSTEGLYSLTVTNVGGCSAITSTIVTTNIQPIINSIPSSGFICPNDSAELICTGAGNYLWQGPGGPIGGNTSTMYAAEPGIYYCIVLDNNGCLLVTNEIEIAQYTTPYLQLPPNTTFCTGDSVLLTIVTNPNSTVLWNAPLSGNGLTEYVHASGTYTCSITSCGITTTATATVLESNPSAMIISNNQVLCAGDSLVLFGNAGMMTYHWLPGGSNFINDTVAQPGVYRLMITDSSGCSAMDSVVVTTATNAVTSAFDAAPLVGCEPLTVTFNNTSINGTSYQWSFGDNGFSNLQNPSHIYTASGSYSVKLITFNTNPCGTFSDTVIMTNYITIYPKPIAAFTADTMIGCVPFTVNFTNTSSNAIYYHWNFGNLDTSNLMNPTTTYTQAGIYTITLVASNTGGCNDTSHLTYLSIVSPPVILSAFAADTLFGCNPLTVTFTNASTNGTSYLWSFGDSTISFATNPTHTFTDSGLFTIKLITINDTSICGRVMDSSIQKDYIYIQDSMKITSNFSGTPLTGCIPLAITISNTSTNGSNYYWNFGNGQTSTDAIPTNIIYDVAGTYKISFITTNPNAKCAAPADTMFLDITADSCLIIGSNTFTPNGDGINDYFTIDAEGYSHYHLEIFNRWGQLLFESYQPQYRWNGYDAAGNEVPDGTYYYIFGAVSPTDKPVGRSGYITLIR